MKIEAPFKGYFTVPEPGLTKVTGQVEFDAVKGIRLTTIDSFKKDTLPLWGDQHWKCIHGYSTNGRYLMLLDCKGRESSSIPGIPVGHFWASSLLSGLQYFDAYAPSIKTTAFRVSYLDSWLNRSGLSYAVDEKEFGGFRVEHKHRGAIPLYRGERFTASIWHSTHTPMFQTHDVLNNIKEEAYINIKYAEDTTLAIAQEDMLMLRDLFSLWISAPVAIEDVSVFIAGKRGDQKRRFDLFFPLGYDCSLDKSWAQHYMIYPYDDLEPVINDAISQWVELYPKIRRGISFYHEAYFSKNRHAFQKFIDYVFSYESVNRALHPMNKLPKDEFEILRTSISKDLLGKESKFMKALFEHANEATLRTRMKESFKRLGLSTVYDKKSSNLHIDRIVNARNDIVHYAVVNSDKTVSDENVVDYTNLLRILNVAELLLAIGLLQEFPLKRIKRNPDFAHLLGKKWSVT